MKKEKVTCWLLALFSLFVFNRCSDELFQFVIPIPFELEFLINEDDGEWEESELVEYADFEDVIEDIDEEATVEDVLVEGVVLILENQDPNLTGIEDVDLRIVDSQNDTTLVYEGESITITPGGGITRKVVTNLFEEGIIKTADFIEGYVDGSSFESFTLVSSGKSTPAGIPLSMNLTVEVNMTINVQQELEVPFFLGND